MKNIGELKTRINGIADTRKITGAMETVSIVKMRRALNKCNSNLYYLGRIRSAIKHILQHFENVSHRYLTSRQVTRAAYIVIAGDKGLCGAYNHSVLDFASAQMSGHDDPYVLVAGQMGREYFEAKKMRVNADFMHIMLSPSVADAMRISDSIIKLYDQNVMDEVYVVYTSAGKTMASKPSIIKLLPLVTDEVVADTDDADHRDGLYFEDLEYYPSTDDVLDELIPQYLTAIIYGALVQSVAAEHSARMVAMSNANKNADEILQRLGLEYNRARQETITNELSEIIASAKSVENVKF